MKTFNRKSLLVTGLFALLVTGFAAQSYQVFQLSNKVSQLQADNGLTPSPSALDPTAGSPNPLADPWAFGNGIDPFTNLWQMQQQMDSLFGSVLGGTGSRPSMTFGSFASSPDIEVKESDQDYEVIIGVPENGELELSTDIEDNTVRVAGSISYENTGKNGSLASSFTGRSQFSRSIPLAKPVDPLAMHTDRKDDQFVITIPKA
ncbi:MAG: Hsp20 family protein [Gammaproteobacteria bacterium]|nr:Hsp20/alpha crystallin family protein [Pseudomonadales bacterium]MCP5348707.1 Hsp20/alpha crystallin family protein [Pseudomonadales bacterium]